MKHFSSSPECPVITIHSSKEVIWARWRVGRAGRRHKSRIRWRVVRACRREGRAGGRHKSGIRWRVIWSGGENGRAGRRHKRRTRGRESQTVGVVRRTRKCESWRYRDLARARGGQIRSGGREFWTCTCESRDA